MNKEEEKQLDELVKIADQKSQEINQQLPNGTYSELRDLLRQTKLAFYKTTDFSRQRWDYFSEYYVFYIDSSLINSLMVYQKTLDKMCADIFDISDDYDFMGIIVKPGSVGSSVALEPKVRFEEIQKEVITQIAQSKFSISIAMAWFTNRSIFEEVNKKVREGLIVTAILDDNEKNHHFFQENKALFEIRYLAISSKYQNLMHEKFCIIDSSVVLHGTYNWTEAANYNKEDMTIDKNISTVSSFSNRFIDLRKLLFI